jgi:hypothetical protein
MMTKQSQSYSTKTSSPNRKTRVRYNPVLVKRIQKLRKGPFVRVPDDPESFMKWLER